MPDLDLEAIRARSEAALNPSPTDGQLEAGTRWWRSAKDVPALIAEVEELRTDRERLQRLYHIALHDGLPAGDADA